MGYLNPALNNPARVNFYRVQLNKDLINLIPIICLIVYLKAISISLLHHNFPDWKRTPLAGSSNQSFAAGLFFRPNKSKNKNKIKIC